MPFLCCFFSASDGFVILLAEEITDINTIVPWSNPSHQEKPPGSCQGKLQRVVLVPLQLF